MNPIVSIRVLETMADAVRASRVLEEIWGGGIGFSPELMFAAARFGGYLSGAEIDGEMIGASFGFLADEGRSLHSHVTGVVDEHAGRGIGFRLKIHQREWARDHGLESITWTFDPLVRRNAWFNLVKLGATPTAYFEDFYGRMHDGRNAGEHSDRLLAVWDVDSEPVGAVEPPSGAVTAIETDTLDVHAGESTDWVLVPTPEDIEDLRRSDPTRARRWRMSVRKALGGMMGAGARVVGMSNGGSYVVRSRP